MAEVREKNFWEDDKTGMSVDELEDELRGIFTRAYGREAAERMIHRLNVSICKEQQELDYPGRGKWDAWVRKRGRKAAIEYPITIVDGSGRWRGTVEDTPEMRQVLTNNRFVIKGTVASRHPAWRRL